MVEQAASSRAAAWLAADGTIVLWTLTPVEVVSALRRLVRESAAEEVARLAEARMDDLFRTCHVVIDVESVKALATRLLRLHALRAFDALQLGAALHWAEGHPRGRTLHTLDSRLAPAAHAGVRFLRRFARLSRRRLVTRRLSPIRDCHPVRRRGTLGALVEHNA